MNAERSAERVGRAEVHRALGDPARLAVVDALSLGELSPSELQGLLSIGSNLLAHHLAVLQRAGVVRRTRSSGDRRRTYLGLVPGALDALVPAPVRRAERVVFVCTENSARSQLAAGLWNGTGTVPATSAGTRPGPAVHPGALAAARRHAVTLPAPTPRHVADVLRPTDVVITVCDSAHEELSHTTHRVHWSVVDPARTGDAAAFDRAVTDLRDRIGRVAPRFRPAEEAPMDQPPTPRGAHDESGRAGKPVVLFLCTHNAGRSQMAWGFLQHLAGDRVVAWSGGSEPGERVNPAAIAAMAERGIDIAGESPKPWTDEIIRAADVVVTMGCGDACPVYPGHRYQDWALPDPAGAPVEDVRPIRDEIERRVRHLLDELGVTPDA